MSTEIIAIDRLTGLNFQGDRRTTPWTVEEIKERAQEMRKPFQPSLDIVDRLEGDLEAGAMVLFDEEEVELAIQDDLVPAEWRDFLTDLVTIKNDIAIIPAGEVEAWRERDRMRRMFLSTRC